MKYLTSLRCRLFSLTIPLWTVPLALLAVMIAAFGLFIPSSGFYWDDWTQLLVARLDRLSTYWAYFSSDRPTSAWTHILFVPLLGLKPLNWQIFTLGLRWLTVLGMAWSLGLIWPKQKNILILAAFLFAVYPAFRQQPTAVAYHQHWLQFALYFGSLGCMILAVQRKKLSWLWVTLALILEGLQFSITEFYAGIELIRPIILWFLLKEEKNKFKRLGKTVLNWLPYLAVLIGYSSWRLFFSGIEKHQATVLFLLKENPLEAVSQLARLASMDEVYILLSSWAKTLDIGLAQRDQSGIVISWLVSLFLALGLWFYFQHLPDEEMTQPNARQEMLFLGAIVTLVGPSPIWLTGGRILADNDFHADRFAMASMWGISLVVVVLIEFIVQNWRRTALLISVLIGLAAGLQLRIANDYRLIWTHQQAFYWQLLWRAPQLEPGTALVIEEPFLAHQELFSTSSAINHLYRQPYGADSLDYWMYRLIPAYEEIDPDQDISFKTVHRIFSFQGTLNNSLVLQYKPEISSCLWVLRSVDALNPDVSPLMQQAAIHSNLSRILGTRSPDPVYPPTEMIGPEPDSHWCTLFQKAELAVQQEEWQQAQSLALQAEEMGYLPGQGISSHAREWVPMISGYLHGKNYQAAGLISQQLIQYNKQMAPMLCLTWQDFSTQYALHPEETAVWMDRLSCAGEK